MSTRHGVWLGPGKVVGTESFREDSPVPRVIWVVMNGFTYKCSPECLRPVADDEVMFRQLAQQYSAGNLPEELEQMTPATEDFASEPEDSQSRAASPERNVRRRVTLTLSIGNPGLLVIRPELRHRVEHWKSR